MYLLHTVITDHDGAKVEASYYDDCNSMVYELMQIGIDTRTSYTFHVYHDDPDFETS
jgi:DNA gyrase inhibitor GyrI